MYALGHSGAQHIRLQKPCYLLGEGYTKTFKELIGNPTDWDSVRHACKYGEVRQLHGALRLRADRGKPRHSPVR